MGRGLRSFQKHQYLIMVVTNIERVVKTSIGEARPRMRRVGNFRGHQEAHTHIPTDAPEDTPNRQNMLRFQHIHSNKTFRLQ